MNTHREVEVDNHQCSPSLRRIIFNLMFANKTGEYPSDIPQSVFKTVRVANTTQGYNNNLLPNNICSSKITVFMLSENSSLLRTNKLSAEKYPSILPRKMTSKIKTFVYLSKVSNFALSKNYVFQLENACEKREHAYCLHGS